MASGGSYASFPAAPLTGGARVPGAAGPAPRGTEAQGWIALPVGGRRTGGTVKKTPWIIAAAAVCVVAIGGGGTAFAMSNEAAQRVRPADLGAYLLPAHRRGSSRGSGHRAQGHRPGAPRSRGAGHRRLDIQIIHRTPVTVTVDGAPQELLTTGDTVADALEDIEYDAEGAASPLLSTPSSAETEGRSTSSPEDRHLRGTEGEDTFEVTALTVDDAMKKVLGDIEDTDNADVPRDTLLEDGAHLSPSSASARPSAPRRRRPPSRRRPSRTTSCYEGTTKTNTEGKTGSDEKVFAENTVDGEVTESELVSEKVAEKPVTEVITKGTKAPKPEPEPEPEPETKAESSSARSREQNSFGEDQREAPSEKKTEKKSTRTRAARAAPSASPPRAWPSRRAPCGTASPSASPVATGRSTRATVLRRSPVH